MIVEERASHIVREATIGGSDLREIIVFEPERKVSFFQAGGQREGVIVNELFEDETGALYLKFYWFGFPEVPLPIFLILLLPCQLYTLSAVNNN